MVDIFGIVILTGFTISVAVSIVSLYKQDPFERNKRG